MSFLATIDPSTYRGEIGNGFWLFQADGHDRYFEYTSNSSSLKAYSVCPPLTAIINKKAQSLIKGKSWLLNKEGAEAGKVATKVPGNLKKLLEHPNALQSWKQFEAQNYIYQQIAGYCVVLPIKPVGFEAVNAVSLWNLPPWMLEVKEKEKINLASVREAKDFFESITLVWKGERTPLSLEDVYIFKDFTPSVCSLVMPESRTKALDQPISNIIGTLESRGVLIDKRGPSYVISSNKSDESGDVPLSAKEKQAVEEEFKQYGLKRKQVQAIITSANIKLETVGFSTRDLMLFEEMEDDIMRLCDGYGMPYRLMASNRNNSLGGSDAEYFNKQLYEDTIIPEAESFYEQWNQFFKLSQYNLTLSKDYTHIACLQADKVKEATARNILNDAKKKEFDAGLITLDQWLQALGEDPLPDGKGNVRVTDLKNSNVPLAVTIGVGGVQSLIQLLTARGISEEARRNTIEIIFGIKPEDAARMVVGADEQNSQGNNAGNNNAGNNAENNSNGS
jgi:hypothetical protein